MKAKKIGIILAAAVSAGMLFTGCGEKSIDPKDYCEVVVKGAEGHAKAYVKYDVYGVQLLLTEKIKDDDWEKAVQAAVVASEIQCDITSDKKTDLKNGDVIEVSIKCDKEQMKKLGYKFKSDSFKYKVSGLEEGIPLDPFDYVDVSFAGLSGKGSVNIDSSRLVSEGFPYFTFDYDSTAHLSNGDSIEIKADCNEDALLTEGYVVTSKAHTYLVSGLKEAKIIDPFEGIVLEYSDVSPKARVSFNTAGCNEFVRNNVTFRTSSTYYANGDNIEVIASYSESKAEENGIVFSRDSSTFVCDGADYYPFSDSDADFTSVTDFFADEITSVLAKKNYYVGGNIHGRSVFTDIAGTDVYTIRDIKMTPVKRIYMYSKDPSNAYNINKLAVVYDIEFTAEKTALEGSTHDDLAVGDKITSHYYATNSAKNISVNNEGKSKDVTTSDTICNIYYISYYGAHPGLLDFRDPTDLNTTVESLTEQLRAENLAEYNVEITDIG